MDGNKLTGETVMSERNARPWDLFNEKIGRVPDRVEHDRMSECRKCIRFNSLTKICRECGCFMPAKTKLPNAFCPIGTWNTWSTQQ